jgi:hypothetical protein
MDLTPDEALRSCAAGFGPANTRDPVYRSAWRKFERIEWRVDEKLAASPFVGRQIVGGGVEPPPRCERQSRRKADTIYDQHEARKVLPEQVIGHAITAHVEEQANQRKQQMCEEYTVESLAKTEERQNSPSQKDARQPSGGQRELQALSPQLCTPGDWNLGAPQTTQYGKPQQGTQTELVRTAGVSLWFGALCRRPFAITRHDWVPSQSCRGTNILPKQDAVWLPYPRNQAIPNPLGILLVARESILKRDQKLAACPFRPPVCRGWRRSRDGTIGGRHTECAGYWRLSQNDPTSPQNVLSHGRSRG